MKHSAYFENLSKLGMVTRQLCSKEENKKYSSLKDDELPPDVYYVPKEDFNGGFVRYDNTDISSQEVLSRAVTYIALNVQTIKSCVVFFTIIAIISIIVSLISIFVK